MNVLNRNFDISGNMLSSSDPLDHVTSYAYDGLGRRISITDALAGVTSYEYNAAGQVISMTDPISRVTTFGYDDLGRQTSLIDNLGHASQTVFDALGNVRGMIDAQGNTTRYMVDLLSRQTASIDPLGGETNFSYDGVGNRLSLTDPVGNVTSWTYDNLNRQLTDTNHLGGVRTFVYDAANNLVSREDRNGRVIEWDYDALNRATEETWLDGATVMNTIATTFDAASQVTGVVDTTANYAYTHDGLGRTTTVDASFAGLAPTISLSQNYDASSRRTRLQTDIGSAHDFVNDYEFDELGRLTRVTQSSQGTGGGYADVASKRVDLDYNAIGQFETIARYASTSAANLVATSTYTYDALARLTSLAHQRGNNTTINSYDLDYDSLNRITSVNQYVDGLSSYNYDTTGQLTGEVDPKNWARG